MSIAEQAAAMCCTVHLQFSDDEGIEPLGLAQGQTIVTRELGSPEGVKTRTVNVRFGSEADIAPLPIDVRFPPESGHSIARRCERLHSTFPDCLGRAGRGKKFD